MGKLQELFLYTVLLSPVYVKVYEDEYTSDLMIASINIGFWMFGAAALLYTSQAHRGQVHCFFPF